MNLDEFNINDIINSIPFEVLESLNKNNVWDYTKYKFTHGYNWILSGRAGGKSTGVQSIIIRTFIKTGYTSIVLRATKTETTYSNMQSYFDGMKGIVFDDGKNMIEKLTDSQYNSVYYNRYKKCFILCNETDKIENIKNNQPFLYMYSFDKSNEICSGVNIPTCRIIFCEECIDDTIRQNVLLDLEHIISTIYRLKADTYVILTGNLSRGNPRLLIDMGLYNKVKSSEIPYILHKTKYNSKIGIELFNALAKEDFKRQKFNNQYFCFDIEGEDIIRGVSNSIPIFRKIPDNIINQEITPTGLYFYSMGYYLEIYNLFSENYQPMYYIQQNEIEPVHDTAHVIITDEKEYCYNTPHVYLSPLKKYPMSVDIIKAIRRDEICYDNYLTNLIVTNLLDSFSIPQNI